MPSKQAIVIGAGFAGLSCATFLAKEGYKVTVLEKNDQAGGRARQITDQGFKFDMGPSWYWMPDVFDHYFQSFNKKVADYYQLQRLDPSYKVVFGKDDYLDIPADYKEFKQMFELLEKGSSANLDKFLEEAAYKYKVGINDLVYRPGRSIKEVFKLEVIDRRDQDGYFHVFSISHRKIF